MVILAAGPALLAVRGSWPGLRRSRVDLFATSFTSPSSSWNSSGAKTEFRSPKSDSGGTVHISVKIVPIIEEHLTHYAAPAKDEGDVNETDPLLFTSPEAILAQDQVPAAGPKRIRRPG